MLTAILAACSKPTSNFRVAGEAAEMDYAVAVVQAPAALDVRNLRERVEKILRAAARELDPLQVGTPLARFNAAAAGRWKSVPRDLVSLTARAQAIGIQTGGAFDITAAPIDRVWRIDACGSRRGTAPRPRVPDRRSLAAARARVGLGLIHTRRRPPALRKTRAGVRIDMRAVLAAVAAERLAGRLERSGVHDYRIAVGDVIRVGGYTPAGRRWPVAADNGSTRRFDSGRPALAAKVACAPALIGQRRFMPLIDPRSGHPVAHRIPAVRVFAADAVTAAALADALRVMGRVAGRDFARRHGIAARFGRPGR